MFIANYKSRILHVDRSNLLAYWMFNETSGSTLIDYSGNGYHGDIVSANLNNLKSHDGRPAAYMDGVTDVISIYSDGLRDNFDETNYTILFYFKAEDWTQTYTPLFRLSCNTSPTKYVSIQHSSANAIRLLQTFGGVSVEAEETSLTSTDWMCLVAQYDGSTLSFYINGVLVDSGSGTYNWGTDVLNQYTCAVMAYNSTYGGATEGNSAHMAIWKSILTLSQIQSISRG